MTRFKYVMFFIIFALLLVAGSLFLAFGLYYSKANPNLSIGLYIGCGISWVTAIITLAANATKLANFDKQKLIEKLDKRDYTCVDFHLDINSCVAKLKAKGYSYPMYSVNTLHRHEESLDRENIWNYYVKIVQVEDIVDIDDILVGLNNHLYTYNSACIYIEKNIDENLKILKEYIKKSIVGYSTNSFKYPAFFAPIVFANNKMYYFDARLFSHPYKTALKETLKTLTRNPNEID